MRTPNLLPLLKEAGVVDAGGQGLAFILEGALKYLNGETLEGRQISMVAQNLDNLAVEEGFGYDIQFHIRGKELNVDADSRHDFGDGRIRVDCGRRVAYQSPYSHAQSRATFSNIGADQGPLVNIIIENMQEQYVDFMAGNTADMRTGAENLGAILPHEKRSYTTASTDQVSGVATIAVAPGEGIREIFQSLGISAMISGGPTMNPSAQDILEAINRVKARAIILLAQRQKYIFWQHSK